MKLFYERPCFQCMGTGEIDGFVGACYKCLGQGHVFAEASIDQIRDAFIKKLEKKIKSYFGK